MKYIHTSTLLRRAVLTCTMLFGVPVSADNVLPDGLYLFPDIQATHISRQLPAPGDEWRYNPALDIFYSLQQERFLALIEYFINRDEKEFERVQLGWQLSPTARLWLGRFHNPLGFWNNAYHHGVHFQPGITRPAFAAFEDDGGIMPMHSTGLYSDSDHYFGGSHINLRIGIVTDAQYRNGKIEPAEISDFGDIGQRDNFSLRVSYYPDSARAIQYSVFFGHSLIDGEPTGVMEIEQHQFGLSALWHMESLELIANYFFLSNTLVDSNTGVASDRFANVYLHANYDLSPRWRVYGRAEHTFNRNNDIYLNLFPVFSTHRRVAGVNYRLTASQRLSIEYDRTHSISGSPRYIRLQWSAFFQ